MIAPRWFTIAVVASIAVLGCKGDDVARPPNSAPIAANAETPPTDTSSLASEIRSPDTPPSETPTSETPTSETLLPESVPPEPRPSEASPDQLSPDKPLPEAPWSAAVPHRFVLLADGSPLLIELRVLSGSQPMDDAARHAAEVVLPYLDSDSDGRVSWDEAASSALLNRLGNGMEVPRGRQRELLFRSYDTNADDQVAPHELIGFVNRGRVSREWLVVRSSLSDPTNLYSPLAQTLDKNGDQRIDSREIDETPRRLRILDSDDDGVLLEREFAAPTTPYVLAMEQNRYSREVPVFFLSEDQADYGELLFRLQEKYMMGAPLLPEDLLQWAPSWHGLDTNPDETIEDDELAAINQRPADVAIRVQFPALDEKPLGKPRDPTLHVKATVGRVSRHSDFETEIELDRRGIAIGIEPADASGGDYDPLKPFIDRADTDDDNLVSSAEYETLQPVLGIGFEILDTDQDGQLTRSELANLVEIYKAISYMSTELVLQSSDNVVFSAIDEDGDGKLAASEIADSSDQIRQLDRDGDGILQPDEANMGTNIVIRQGYSAPGMQPSLARNPRQGKIPASSNIPAWFQAMDSNHNGQIERREFLGRSSDFQRADSDGDGSLEWSEADSI